MLQRSPRGKLPVIIDLSFGSLLLCKILSENFILINLFFAATAPSRLAFFDLGGAFGDSLTAFIEGTAAHVGGSKFGAHPSGEWDYWVFEANPK
jgi:hypothetical protein